MRPPAFFWCFLSNSTPYTELSTCTRLWLTELEHGLNKGRGSKFHVESRVRQETPEERYEYNNKDEDNSPKTLNEKNHKALSQKFRQLISNNTI